MKHISEYLDRLAGNGRYNEVLKQVQDLGKELAEREVARFDIITQLTQLRKDMQFREAEMMIEILNETDGEGKKKYTNEAARKTELEKRKATDETYRRIEETIRAVERVLTEHDAETKRLEVDLKARWAWLRFIEARLRAAAALAG